MKFSLEDPTFLIVLLIAVAVFAVVLISVAVFLVFKSRKKSDDAKPEAEKKKKRWNPFPPEVPGMKESFRAAMQRLREKLPGWNERYNVPWYALVGEEGSGKTTLASILSGRGEEVVATEWTEFAPRWLLLDKAVLIDLPGKSFLAAEPQLQPKAGEAARPSHELLAFLDDEASALQRISDRTAWVSFLRHTSRSRPRQPLNGIVLTISASELLALGANLEEPQQAARITELSGRLDDVVYLLGLSLPIYVLVTKCDVLPGFSSYSRCFLDKALGRLSAADSSGIREFSDDLFGWSNPHLLDRSFTPDWVDEAFHDTNEVLLRRQLEMLAETKNPAAADGVFVFPFELQNLREPIRVILDRAFKPTAYHSPHLFRGIYFCGRAEEEEDLDLTAHVTVSADRNFLRGIFGAATGPVLFVRNLFEAKVFPERYLATPIAPKLFSRNRAVMIARIAACALVLVLGVGCIHAWNRLSTLQRTRINPTLQALSSSLDNIAVSSGEDVTPAVDLFNTLGTVHEAEYYSSAMPYSYIDFSGLHRNLRDTLEQTFEVVVLRSCKFALEDRISLVLQSKLSAKPPVIPLVSPATAAYLPGNAWSTDPAYQALDAYLTGLNALHQNIGRYQVINSAGSGSFKQLNALLHYLGGRDLPDSSRFAQDANYQRLLLNATWQPISIPPNYDKLTASATMQHIYAFYQSWFGGNPLIAEVQSLSGNNGLQGISSQAMSPSNEDLRAFVSQSQAIDSQLKNGSYDWLAESFNRQNYPALGPKLDDMSFADDQFTDTVSSSGSQQLDTLKAALQTTPEVLDIQERPVRLNGEVRTVSSILAALLGYEVMSDSYQTSRASGCPAIPNGAIWNQSYLEKAVELESTRGKIEAELLPGLPGQYRDAIQRLVDQRTTNAVSIILQNAAAANPNKGDDQAALQIELQNFSQSSTQLKQIAVSLAGLHATAESSCIERALSRQANSLLVAINQQLPAVYGPLSMNGQSDYSTPVSLWLYGVNSSDDLQSYLASERQQVESLSAEAAPLVQLLHSQGGHSDILTRWRSISQDVDALQAKKPGNPIQALEAFIATDLDKIVPESACKGNSLRQSGDVFLTVRAELSNLAVAHCRATAVARFNEIAAGFNAKLGGRFPFSKLADTRSGTEADPADIAGFYEIFDRDCPGLSSVLPTIVTNPNDVVSFLAAVAAARPLVFGTAKNPLPALEISLKFRTNRNREVFGNRIAQWNFNVGQQSVSAPPDPGGGPPMIWHFGDTLTLGLRYANNSPETPATANPSPAALVTGKSVAYQYSDTWSLFSLLRDHPSTSADPANQYRIDIPNAPLSGSSAGTDTIVYVQMDLLPIGAKPGGETLPVPAFPYQAPMAALKPANGE